MDLKTFTNLPKLITIYGHVAGYQIVGEPGNVFYRLVYKYNEYSAWFESFVSPREIATLCKFESSLRVIEKLSVLYPDHQIRSFNLPYQHMSYGRQLRGMFGNKTSGWSRLSTEDGPLALYHRENKTIVVYSSEDLAFNDLRSLVVTSEGERKGDDHLNATLATHHVSGYAPIGEDDPDEIEKVSRMIYEFSCTRHYRENRI